MSEVTKFKLNKKEIALVNLMHEFQMIKAARVEGMHREFDSNIKDFELTGYDFNALHRTVMKATPRLTFAIFIKTWPSDSTSKAKGELPDGKLIEELSETEQDFSKEQLKQLIKDKYGSNKGLRNFKNVTFKDQRTYHPTIFTYIIYESKYIVPLGEMLCSFKDIYYPIVQPNQTDGLIPKNSFSEGGLTKLIEQMQF